VQRIARDGYFAAAQEAMRTFSLLRSMRGWACLGGLLLLSGCLTIEENYTFKKDGSGTLEYVMDISEMAELMKGLPGGSKGKDDGAGAMDLKDNLVKLRSLPGISKVKLKKEKDGFVQRLSFKFKDIASLNGALNQLMPDSTNAAQEFFRWEGSTLVRTNNRHAQELGGDMGGETGDSTDMTAMLAMMHYKYSFKFAKDIGAVQAVDGMTREPKGTKEIKLSTDWSVISKDPAALDLRIELK
jgi:hypothetical protein